MWTALHIKQIRFFNGFTRVICLTIYHVKLNSYYNNNNTNSTICDARNVRVLQMSLSYYY